MQDTNDIYKSRILDHYEAPYHRGQCPNVTHSHTADNPLCGDSIKVELSVDSNGVVKSAWFNGDGCCISQAAASMLMEFVEGKTVDDLTKLSPSDIIKLIGIELTPNRQKCGMLCLRAAQHAILTQLPKRKTSSSGSSCS